MTLIKRNRLFLAAGACLVFLTPACAPRSLIFTTYTTVGLDISATDAKPTKAVLGYKRFEGAIVPVDPEARDAAGAEREAMSVYAAVAMSNTWLNGLDLTQAFATGPAAVNAVRNPAALNDAIRNLRPEPTPTAAH
jgi:hypothetical protein